MSYVLFPARHRGRPVNAPPGEKGPTMSLYGRNGSIRLNEAAVARLAGDSGRVVLWWDADRRRLAFSTATPLDGLNTTDKLSRCRNGGAIVSARALFRKIGWDEVLPRCYRLTEADGLLETAI